MSKHRSWIGAFCLAFCLTSSTVYGQDPPLSLTRNQSVGLRHLFAAIGDPQKSLAMRERMIESYAFRMELSLSEKQSLRAVQAKVGASLGDARRTQPNLDVNRDRQLRPQFDD